MTKKPNFNSEAESRKKAEKSKHLLFGIVFSLLIVVMITGMLFLDIYGENKEKEQSHSVQPQDAAEH